jgi:pyruvate dehydrogenase E2 component (dihydrolipoamide acetyltransferase)
MEVKNMRKLIAVFLLLAFVLCQGCAAARKPAPEPEQKPQVVPESSKVGFSPVDLNKAPEVVKNVAGDLAKREAATWMQVNGTSYVLISTGETATGKRVDVTDVTQRIPAQDFVWIDVKAKYVTPKEGEKAGPLTVISLKLPSQTINGVSFEVAKTPEAVAPAPSPVPAPATKPAPAAPAPATPAPTPAPAPAPTPTPTPRKATPEAPKKEPAVEEKKDRS